MLAALQLEVAAFGHGAGLDAGIGDHHHSRGVAQKTAAQSGDLQPGFPGTLRLGFTLLKSLFNPDFLESLSFSIVVAEHLDAVVLAQPTMHLGEELTPLGLGDLRLGQGVGDGPERLKTLQGQGLLLIFGRGRGG